MSTSERRTTMKTKIIFLSGIVLMVGCSGPLDLLTGGGPNIAANTQVGKTSTQTVGTTNNTDQTIVRPQARDIKQTSDTNKVSADRVETVVVNEYPAWLIIAFAVALFLDSPIRMIQDLLGAFKRKK
jgi:hypothetical protein